MTSYNYSYNVLINRLEAFAAGHFLIKRFTHGQIDLADQLQDDQYPFMHVTPDTITPIQGGMQFGFMIMFADIPRDKEYKAEYQREVISDCVRLGQDLIAEVRNGLQLFGFDVQLVNNPTFEPFIEEYKNTVTGVAFTIQLEVPWDWSACDIPAVWTVGGSSSGGSGTGYGITLRTNGVDNAVQNILDLVEGTNVTITDNGDGSVTIDAAGGGGGGGEYVSTEWNANHTTAQGNPYLIGDRVWYNGSVYRCIANNDGINPSNPTYWTLQSVGYRLRQTPVDWNASTGDYQILNKPTIPTTLEDLLAGNAAKDLIQYDGTQWVAISGLTIDDLLDVSIGAVSNNDTLLYNTALNEWQSAQLGAVAYSNDYNDLSNLPTIPAAQVNSDWNSVSGVSEILNKPTIPAAQVNSDWNAVSGLAEILNKPTIPTTLDSLTNVNVPTPSNAQVLTFDTATSQWIASTPTAPTPTGYYGAFQDNTTQTAVSANTAYAVKLNTTDLTNGVSVVNDGSGNPTRITLANTGIYNIQFSLQLEKTGGSGNFTVDVWVRKNGVDIPNTTGKVVLTGSANASPVVAAWNYVLDLAANDYLQLMWSTSNNNSIILAATATSPHPGIPSAILTVTQQAGIMAGTGITAINSLTGAAQSLVVGTGGTDFDVTSSGTTHTFNLPTASAANRGALSSADWSTFNGKQNAVGFTDVGTALATIPNPSATRYIKINSNNSVSAITASQLLSDLGISSNIIINRNFTDTAAVTGTIAPTLIFSVLISANTFQTNDWMTTRLNARTTGTGGAEFRIYLNTSAAIGGTIIGTWNAALNSAAMFERNYMVTAIGTSGSIKYAPFSGVSPYTANNVAFTSVTFNTTIDQYLVFAVQNNNVAGSSTTHGNLITITR